MTALTANTAVSAFSANDAEPLSVPVNVPVASSSPTNVPVTEPENEPEKSPLNTSGTGGGTATGSSLNAKYAIFCSSPAGITNPPQPIACSPRGVFWKLPKDDTSGEAGSSSMSPYHVLISISSKAGSALAVLRYLIQAQVFSCAASWRSPPINEPFPPLITRDRLESKFVGDKCMTWAFMKLVSACRVPVTLSAGPISRRLVPASVIQIRTNNSPNSRIPSNESTP